MGAAGEIGYGSPRQMQSPGGVSSPGSYNSRTPSNRAYSGYSQSMQRGYMPGMAIRSGVGPDGHPNSSTYQMEAVSRAGSVVSGRQTPGFSASSAESYGPRRPGEQNNPYFPPVSNTSGWGSSATLPRSNTPRNASVRSHSPRASSSTRSMTPAKPPYRPYAPGQPPLPRLYTSSPSAGESYQPYSASSQSPAQSAFTLQTPYRSYTQPNLAAVAAEQYSHQTMSTSQDGFKPQQRSGHAPPTQRPGTAPLTDRQRTPVADDVMDPFVALPVKVL